MSARASEGVVDERRDRDRLMCGNDAPGIATPLAMSARPGRGIRDRTALRGRWGRRLPFLLADG